MRRGSLLLLSGGIAIGIAVSFVPRFALAKQTGEVLELRYLRPKPAPPDGDVTAFIVDDPGYKYNPGTYLAEMLGRCRIGSYEIKTPAGGYDGLYRVELDYKSLRSGQLPCLAAFIKPPYVQLDRGSGN